MLKKLALLFLFSFPAFAQAPQPDYSKYGSYSRQLAVYESQQLRIQRLQENNARRAYYRSVREPQTRIITVRPQIVRLQDFRPTNYNRQRRTVFYQ